MRSFLLVTCFAIVSSIANGQIFFTAKMDSAQEIPAPTGLVPGKGTGSFVLNSNATQLYYNITVNGLSGAVNAGHFHNGAAGVGAGVVKTLNFVNNTATGTWSSTDATQPLTDSLLSELLRGRLYINVHTTTNGGGEIRGQVLLTSGVGFTAKMDSAQEVPVPAGAVPGKGTISVTLGTNGQVTYDGTVTGLSGTLNAGHFHSSASAGVAGGVVKTLTFTNNTTTGSWTSSDASQPLTDVLLRDLIKGRLYVNVHTTANGGGEIRGQVLVNNGASAIAKMDSIQEIPAPTGLVPGKGTGSFWLNAAGTAINYSVTVNGLSGTLNAGHFHNAAAGVAGGVVKTLTFVNNNATGTWSSTDANQPLTDSLMSEFLNGRLYVNVHTTANGGGEIRGQVLLSTSMGFAAKLDSAQEIPAPTGAVSGRGTAAITLGTNGLTYDATVTGLSGTLNSGHFHNAAAGVAGGVVKTLTFTNNTTSGTWKGSDGTQPLTDVLLRELVHGRLYMNVHTTANGGGEIRGQVNNSGGLVTGVVEKISNQVPASFQLDQNYPNPFNPTTTISFALQTNGRATLKIYNLLGQQVATLLDEVKSAGVYKVSFDASALSSGVYFYRLSTSGGGSEAKKMVLMK